MPIIDVHTHMFTRRWLELLRAHGDPYSVQVRPDGRDEIYRGADAGRVPAARPLRLRPAHRGDGRGRHRRLDRVAHLPERVLGRRGRSARGRARVERLDGRGAARPPATGSGGSPRCRGSTRRGRSRSSRASCDEGAVGVMVIANVAGRSLTEPAFAPIWAEIDRRALPVLVHPGEPPGSDLMDMGSYDLSWLVGFMFDTTLAIDADDLRRVPRPVSGPQADRRPRRRCPPLPRRPDGEGRRGRAAGAPPDDRDTDRVPPPDLVRLHHVRPRRARATSSRVVGAERVLFGTDWPHQVHDVAGSLANTAALPADQRDAIRGANALRLFGL